MAGATVIDQLIVKLGLDPSDFTKGQKEAAAGQVKLEQQVKKSSQGMSSSIVGFTGKLLGIATAAALVKKTIGYVSDLSTEVRQLGIDSRNFGVAANELRNFQNIAEMNGGKAEEVTRTVGDLTKAIYNLAYNGQISDSLIMLGRLGVQFQDTAGHARNFKDVVLDTEKKVQQLMASGSLSRENANQMLQQAGFDPGLTQAMLAGNVSAQLAKQQSRTQVTPDIVSAATKWEQSATNRDQAIAAATLRTLPTAAAAGSAVNDTIAAGADYAGKTDFKTAMADGAEGVKKASRSLIDSFEAVSGSLWRSMFPHGRAAYESTIQSAASKYGVPSELLAGVLKTESNFDPSAVSPNGGGVGIAQLNPKFHPKAGRNPYNDIDDAAKELSRLMKDFTEAGLSQADATKRALQAYNAGETRVLTSMAEDGAPLSKETQDYPGKVLAYAGQAAPTPGAEVAAQRPNNHTEVSIGRVEVNTQAKDADGIASEISDATERKLMAAQADGGMN